MARNLVLRFGFSKKKATSVILLGDSNQIYNDLLEIMIFKNFNKVFVSEVLKDFFKRKFLPLILELYPLEAQL